MRELKKLKVATFSVPMRGRADLGAINAVRKLLVKYSPDILHTHGQRGGLIGRLAAQLQPIKIIHTEHTYTHDFKTDHGFLHWTHLRAMQTLDLVTDKVIAVSEAVKIFLDTARISKAHKIVTIHNGIETRRPKVLEKEVKAFKEEHGLGSKDCVIGTIGSLNKQKDTATLVKSFAGIQKRWPNSKLLIIGRGELKRELENLSARLGIAEKVIFTGSLSNVEIPLQAMNIFVLPSKSEAFGISILEAMRAEVPIIASKVGGIPEIIKHNLNGLLVEQGDVKKLTTTILKLLNDKKLQKKLVKQYPDTLKNFTATKMVKAVEKLYEEQFSPIVIRTN